LIDSYNMINRFWHNISLPYWKFPIYTIFPDGIKGFVYQWTDNNSYFIDENFIADVSLNSIWTIPLGIFWYNGLWLSSLYWSGTKVLFDASKSAWMTLNTWSILYSFSYFSNPVVYFTTTSWYNYDSNIGLVKWDMNCKTQGYDSCGISGWVHKCMNSTYELSPNGEVCEWEVNINPPPIGSCTDKILNQDELSVDFWWVCGNQICSIKELNYKYRAGWYWTGAYLSWTVQTYWTGTEYIEGSYYIEDFTKYWWNTTFDKMEFSLHGAIISNWLWSSYGSFRDLIDSHSMIIDTPWYIQSPINWSYADLPFSSVQIGTVYPIEWISISGTWTGNTGSLNPNKIGNVYRNVPNAWCVFLADKNNNYIQDKQWSVHSEKVSGNSCFYIGTYDNPNIIPVTGLIDGDTVKLYKINMVFTDSISDGRYWITRFDVGRYGDQLIENYVCVNQDTGVIQTPEWEISKDTLDEISGDADKKRKDMFNSLTGSLFWNVSFSFWILPSVGTGADCSNIFNTASESFMYANANSKLSWDLKDGVILGNVRWSCPILTSNICWTAYDGANYITNGIYKAFYNSISIAWDVIVNSVSYIGTPEYWKNYCFAGKNWKYNGRVSLYTDTKGVSHTIELTTLTLFDLLALGLMSAWSLYILLKK